MSDGEDFGESDELIENQLRFLRERGPQPNLEDLDEEAAAEARLLLEVVDVLVDAAPRASQLIHDPVAIRLGLVAAPTGDPSPSASDPTDDVTLAVQDVARRFSVSLTPAATDGTTFERRFECRSMVENIIIVVVPEDTTSAAIAAHARGSFALTYDLSAVAYSTRDAASAVILTYGDCHHQLQPASGWSTGVPLFRDEPLEIALGRYVEQSDPAWENVQTLAQTTALAGWEVDAAAVADGVLAALAGTKPRLDHKVAARDFVAALDNATFVAWTRRIQAATLDKESLLAEIREIVEGEQR